LVQARMAVSGDVRAEERLYSGPISVELPKVHT